MSESERMDKKERMMLMPPSHVRMLWEISSETGRSVEDVLGELITGEYVSLFGREDIPARGG